MNQQDLETKDTFNSVGLKNYKDLLSLALRAAHICVFEVDLVKQKYSFFENSEAIFGVSAEKILNDIEPYSTLPPHDYQKAVSDYFTHPDDFETVAEAFEQILRGYSSTYNARMRAGDGGFLWCKIDVTPVIQDGVATRMIGVISDMSQMMAKFDTLEKNSHMDSFTGVYLKKYSLEAIKQILRKEKENNHALLLLDLDHFKEINDTFGHMVGDEVLQAVAQRLTSSFRNTDVVGRFGGDEFIVFMRDLNNKNIIRQKIEALQIPTEGEFGITKSIGIALYPQDGESFAQLFEAADKALYRAKKNRNTFAFCDEK